MDKKFDESVPYIFRKKKALTDYSEIDQSDWEKFWSCVEDDTTPTLDEIEHPYGDMVNSPSHYTSGRHEAIEVIEDAITEAPTSNAAFLHGQVLKYMLRLWCKIDAKEDAEKARWYLNRLIDSLD